MVFQKSYDFPNERSPAYQITIEDGKWVILRWDQVEEAFVCTET